MRIPWFIVFPLSLILFAGVLWFGAHKQDFTIEPSDIEVSESLAKWQSKHPPLPPREHPIEEVKKTQPAPAIEIPVIPSGPADTVLDLNGYIEHRDLGAASYIQLATQLEEQQQLDHALLAWERVIDSTHATPKQAAQAHAAILKLRASQGVWNTDPASNFPLVIHVHTPAQYKAAASEALSQLCDDIREASSYLAAPQLLLETTPEREGFPTPPVRIWLSSTNPHHSESPQLTLRLSDGEAPLDEQLYIATYRTIAGQLQNTENLMPPADLTTASTPREALTSHLTRLHWKTLIDSLQTEQQLPPPAALIVEE